MECTSLNLLTRDGALAVTFTPALTAQQYAELYDLACSADTANEMSSAVQSAAERWGTDVVIDLPLAVAAVQPQRYKRRAVPPRSKK